MPADINATFLANTPVPEVLAPMVEASVQGALRVTPFCKIDNTLQGRPGDTVKVPIWQYIGMAKDTAEGADIDLIPLSYVDKSHTIKKVAIGVGLTDEAILSAYGNPSEEAGRQLSLSIAEKIEEDVIETILNDAPHFDPLAAISYDSIVDAVDEMQTEFTSTKALIIHPKMLKGIRKDKMFQSADSYSTSIVMSGEIGSICNCRIVLSSRIPLVGGKYQCIMVELSGEGVKFTGNRAPDGSAGAEFKEPLEAVTIFVKRGVNVERERKSRNRSTEITADYICMSAVTNPKRIQVVEFQA